MLGTINIWLLGGMLIALVYLLWVTHHLQQALGRYIILNNTMMQQLDQMLQDRDKEVDQKIDNVEDKLEYMNEKENSKLS